MEHDPSAFERFLSRLRQDFLDDAVRDLAHYLAAFPGAEDAIRREYAAALFHSRRPREERTSEDATDIIGATSVSFWFHDDPTAGKVFRSLAALGLPAGRPEAPPFPQVGEYCLVAELGSGAMGGVYRGVSVRTGELAAVKLALATPTARDALVNEVRCLQRVSHAAIPRLLAHGVEAGVPWFAVQLIQGKSLAHVLRDRGGGSVGSRRITRGELHEFMGWFEELADALDALARAGLIHRDIKPGNVIIDEAGGPHLIDLGLAMDETSVAAGLAGTIPFMAPEQVLQGPLAMSPASDIYALAATFHYAVSGRRYATAEVDSAALVRVATKTPPPVSATRAGVPATLDPIFRKALSKDPALRYRYSRELAEDLRRWSSRRRLLHCAQPLRQRARFFMERQPRATALLAGVLLLVSGTFVHEAVTTRDNRDWIRESASTLSMHGEHLEALRLVREGSKDFGADPGYADTYRYVATGAAPDLLEVLFQALTFSDPGQPNATWRRICTEALEHLRYCWHSSFVVQVGIGGLMEHEYEESIRIAERHLGMAPEDQMVKEILTSLLLDSGEYDRAMLLFPTLDNTDRPSRKSEVTCLRAWRWIVLFQHSRLEGSPITKPDLAIPLELVAHVLKAEPEHALALTIRTICLAEQGHYEKALKSVDALSSLTTHPAHAEHAGNFAVWRARLAIVCAASASDVSWNVAISHVHHAIGCNPRYLDAITNWLFTRIAISEAYSEWKLGVRWATFLLDRPQLWTTNPDCALKLIEAVVYGMSQDKSPDLAWIGSNYPRLRDSVDLPPTAEDWGQIHDSVFWCVYRKVDWKGDAVLRDSLLRLCELAGRGRPGYGKLDAALGTIDVSRALSSRPAIVDAATVRKRIESIRSGCDIEDSVASALDELSRMLSSSNASVAEASDQSR